MTGFKWFVFVAALVAAGSAATSAPAQALDATPAGLGPAPAPAGAPTRDGTWAGPRVHTFYGYLQVEAVIAAGALTDVHVKEYPAHDGTSRRINRIAIPYLVKSAVTAGKAEVDAISGATITSKAFARSLESALAGAQK